MYIIYINCTQTHSICYGYVIVAHGYCIVHGYSTWVLYMVTVFVIVCCVHKQSSMSIVGLTSPPCPSVSLFISVYLFALVPPSEESNSLTAQGPKQSLSLFVWLFGRSSLSVTKDSQQCYPLNWSTCFWFWGHINPPVCRNKEAENLRFSSAWLQDSFGRACL